MYLFWLLFSRPLQQIRNYNNNNNNYIETKNEKPKKKFDTNYTVNRIS